MDQPMKFKHPATFLVAGMTGTGKTWWVKKLLEHADVMMDPPPQRILWCYGQWQPLYEEMKRTLYPKI
jgi:hypothetical protein